MKVVTAGFLSEVYPKRRMWDRKGDHGKVLIIGGSRRYRGAPALCALSALRAGADIAVIAAPESAADVIAAFSPNIITEPLVGDYLNPSDVPKLLNLAEGFDSIIIGNGLGRMAETGRAVREFLRKVQKPCVIDADAIHLISDEKRLLRKGWIVTPHAGEFFSLSGHEVGNSVETRIKAAMKFSSDFGCVVLLKGHKDVIASGKEVFVNSTGNPFMTVGGTGDVLAGICGAFLGMKMKPVEAAAAAAYVCGAAGDRAAGSIGHGLLATDVIERIPAVLRRFV
ncbi:MAG: NAD(P)H-hydrate dehydratase [Candidatus Aenigmatarchaeota archaeon]